MFREFEYPQGTEVRTDLPRTERLRIRRLESAQPANFVASCEFADPLYTALECIERRSPDRKTLRRYHYPVTRLLQLFDNDGVVPLYESIHPGFLYSGFRQKFSNRYSPVDLYYRDDKFTIKTWIENMRLGKQDFHGGYNVKGLSIVNFTHLFGNNGDFVSIFEHRVGNKVNRFEVYPEFDNGCIACELDSYLL